MKNIKIFAKNKLLVTFVFVTFGFTLMSLNTTKIFAGSCTYTGSGGGTWDTGGNWSGTCAGAGGIPDDGDDVTIPNNVSTNNDIVGLDLATLTFSGSPGGTLSGNAFSISNYITGSFPHIISPQITLLGGGPVALSTNAYNGGIVISGASTQLVAAPSVLPWGISSNISGDGSISLNDTGVVSLSGGGTGLTGSIFASGDTQLSVTGSWSFGQEIYLSDGATLFGPGIGGSFVYTDGTANYSPSRFGLDSATYMSGAEFDFAPGDTISLVIGGTGSFDSIFNYGFGPDLTGVNLSLSLTYTPTAGDTFMILSADGGISGTFNGLPHGSRIDIGGQSFIITYTAGSARLTAVGGLIEFFYGAITTNPTAPKTGQAFTLTAVLGSNFSQPTGTAELFDGATSLGSVAVSGGNAVFNIPGGLTTGSHSLTIQYGGNLIYSAATSDPLVLNVAAPLAETGIEISSTIIITFMVLSIIGFIFTIKKFNVSL